MLKNLCLKTVYGIQTRYVVFFPIEFVLFCVFLSSWEKKIYKITDISLFWFCILTKITNKFWLDFLFFFLLVFLIDKRQKYWVGLKLFLLTFFRMRLHKASLKIMDWDRCVVTLWYRSKKTEAQLLKRLI